MVVVKGANVLHRVKRERQMFRGKCPGRGYAQGEMPG